MNAFAQVRTVVVGGSLAVALAGSLCQAAWAQQGTVEHVEGENLVERARATQGEVAQQDMQRFGRGWSGNSQLFWRPQRNGATLTLVVTVRQAGKYSLASYLTKAPDYGTVQFLVNGQKVGAPYNGYAQRVEQSGRLELGEANLNAGANSVQLQVVGKDNRSSGYLVGIDGLAFTVRGETPKVEVRPPVVNLRPQPPAGKPAGARPGVMATPPASVRVPNLSVLVKSGSDRPYARDALSLAAAGGRVRMLGHPTLKVWNGQGGDFRYYLDETFIESRDARAKAWEFQLSNVAANAKRAVWQVSYFAPAMTTKNWQEPPGLLASGELTTLPATGKQGIFTIDLTSFLGPAAENKGAAAATPLKQPDAAAVPPSQSQAPAGKAVDVKQPATSDLSKKTTVTASSLTSRLLDVKRPALFLAHSITLGQRMLYVRIVALDDQARPVGNPSNVVRIGFGLPEQPQIQIPDAGTAPKVEILEFVPIRWEHPDAYKYWVVTRDVASPLGGQQFLYRKGQKLFIDPAAQRDKDLVDLIGDALESVGEFFVDAVNWVAEAYETIKHEALDVAAGALCGDNGDCRAAVSAGLDIGLAALGMPPDIPNFDQLVQLGKGELVDVIQEAANQNSPIPIPRSVTEKLVDEVINQAEGVANGGGGGGAVSSWIRPDPDYQYRPAMAVIRVTNTDSQRRKGTFRIAAAGVFAGTGGPLPELGPGESRTLHVFFTEDYRSWYKPETQLENENRQRMYDRWWDNFQKQDMALAASATMTRVGTQLNSSGQTTLRHRPDQPYKANAP